MKNSTSMFTATMMGFVLLNTNGLAGIADSTTGALDIGSVRAGDSALRELLVKNSGEKPITIKDVSTSCSSLQVTGAAKTIPQNGNGVIMIEFRPLRSGHFDLQVLVETDRTKDPPMTFRWSGEVLPAGANDRQPVDPASGNVLVGVADFGKTFGEKERLILDVRPEARFDLTHIEGSMNFPLWSLKGMALKTKSVVLVGQGSDDTALVREALALRQLGFKSVYVLEGGIRAWVLAGLPVQGAAPDTTQTGFIDPIDFLSSPQDSWLVLETDAVPPTKHTIPGSVRVSPGADTSKRLSEEIGTALRSNSAPAKILLISAQGEKYEILEKTLPKGLSVPVFYMNGGAKAYLEVAAQWVASLDRRELTLAGLPASSATAAGGAVLRSNQGCSSCPGKVGRR